MKTTIYRTTAFLAIQAALLAAAIVAVRAHAGRAEADRALPPLSNEPLVVRPLYDDPRVVSDEQLARVLAKLLPRLGGPEPKIYNLDHALRFWGPDARFADRTALAGVAILNTLLDHTQFAAAWGPKTKPLLLHDVQGVGVRVKEGYATSSHVDHVLSAVAEAGVTLDYPVRTPLGSATVRAMVERSLRQFSLNQYECDFSALTYALYVRSPRPWKTSEEQEITFDRLAARLMREPAAAGPCYGTHRLYDLTVLLRADDDRRILSPECRETVRQYLKTATAQLVKSQRPGGFWDEKWAEETALANDEEPAQGPGGGLSDELQVTGHMLEWWAVAPKEIQPPRDVVVCAGHWLVKAVDDLDDKQVRAGFAFLSHVGRALALWRGHFPAYFLKQGSVAAGGPGAAHSSLRGGRTQSPSPP